MKPIFAWLNKNAQLASWIQTFGVLVGICFAVFQLRQSAEALKASAAANELALKNTASDLLVGINEAALHDSTIAGEYAGHKRLHLMRIHYFYRVHGLNSARIFDAERWQAETTYLRWAITLPDFVGVWNDFRFQYPRTFREWVDEIIQEENVPAPSADPGATSAIEPS